MCSRAMSRSTIIIAAVSILLLSSLRLAMLFVTRLQCCDGFVGNSLPVGCE